MTHNFWPCILTFWVFVSEWGLMSYKNWFFQWQLHIKFPASRFGWTICLVLASWFLSRHTWLQHLLGLSMPSHDSHVRMWLSLCVTLVPCGFIFIFIIIHSFWHSIPCEWYDPGANHMVHAAATIISVEFCASHMPSLPLCFSNVWSTLSCCHNQMALGLSCLLSNQPALSWKLLWLIVIHGVNTATMVAIFWKSFGQKTWAESHCPILLTDDCSMSPW